LPYEFYNVTGGGAMPTQYGSSVGIGINIGGRNAEEPTHIITGPTRGSYQQGPTFLKAEKPPH
jgi:hypothetical protein